MSEQYRRDLQKIGGTWQLRYAQAPWFGCCAGTCGRELGWPDLELVARRIGASDEFECFCVPCVTEIIGTAETAFFTAQLDAGTP